MVNPSDIQKVSKHYIKNGKFEIDHHRDVVYPAIEPHYHEFYEMLYFVSGHVKYIVGDEVYILQSGDVLFIPPNLFHNPIFDDFNVPYERYVLWVSLKVINELSAIDEKLTYFLSNESPKRFLLRNSNTMCGSFLSIFLALEVVYNSKRILSEAQLKASIIQLLAEYNRALLEECKYVHKGYRNTLLTDVLHYVQNHIDENLSLEAVASIFYIDKYTLSHQFKNYMGISYYQYILQQRLLVGKKFILEGIPPTTVYSLCGFHDYSNFYRAFRKEYGVSPAKFKKLHDENIDAFQK